MELELGGRYSDYADTDSTWTYKVTTNIQFNNWMRLRGGYNRATRAPNLGELFLNEQEIFTAAGAGVFIEPCSARSNAPFGAAAPPSAGAAVDPNPNPATQDPPFLASGQTLEGAVSTYLICRAQMGEEAAKRYYGDPNDKQNYPGITAPLGTGSSWVLQVGNRNLKSEKADTWTLGFVFTSVADNPWLARITAAVDWWKVDIHDAIQLYSADYANYLCYGTRIVRNQAEAEEQAATDACQSVPRNPTSGGADITRLAYDNLATIATSGIDVQLNWSASFADLGATKIPGSLGFNLTTSILNYYRTKASPLDIDLETDWKGTLGPNLSGTNPGAYDYRLNAGLNWRVNPFSVSLRWRFLPGVWGAGMASQHAIIANNERVAAGGEGRILNYTPSVAIKADSYSAFDMSFNWTVNGTWSLRAGIDNLLDKQPVITGASKGRPYDPKLTPQQNQDNLRNVCSDEARTKGCRPPTTFSLATTGQGSTSAGYYDVLGRRYFVGFRAKL
jgi:outer membrane receptor protein involved in Fe transport